MSSPEWKKWLRGTLRDPHSPARAALGTHASLAMLTGQDMRALGAIAACWELYFDGDNDARTGALRAVAELLPGLQRKCWPFARELIAFGGDWSFRDQLWPFVLGMAAFTSRGTKHVDEAWAAAAAELEPLRLAFSDTISQCQREHVPREVVRDCISLRFADREDLTDLIRTFDELWPPDEA